jgi:hypothetical protein
MAAKVVDWQDDRTGTRVHVRRHNVGWSRTENLHTFASTARFGWFELMDKPSFSPSFTRTLIDRAFSRRHLLSTATLSALPPPPPPSSGSAMASTCFAANSLTC